MTDSQADPELQKIYHLEVRMRNTDRREPQNLQLPSKKIEPSLIKDAQTLDKSKENADSDAENHKFSEFSLQNAESIDLKTNQKLQEISVDSNKPAKFEEKPGNLAKIPPKLGSDCKKPVKRRLDMDLYGKKRPVELKTLVFEDKSPISENGDELLGFAHNNLNNNTRITDYFEVKPSKKSPAIEKKSEKPVDFHSVRASKASKPQANGLINDYFKRNKAEIAETKAEVSEFVRKEFSQAQIPECLGENLRLKEEIRKLNKKILDKDSQISEGQGQLSELVQENKLLQQNVKYFEESLAKYSTKAKETLCKLLLESEGIKRRELKSHLYVQRERLGEYVNQRQGHKFVDVWVDGYDLRNLKEKINKVKAEREELEKRKKSFKSKKTSVFPSKSSLFSAHFSDSETNFDSNSNGDLPAAELKNRINFQITMLQREETSLCEELKRLEAEKIAYIQQYKRQYEEDNCRFAKADPETKLSAWPFLNKKYQVLCLLGKGGFSEVYKVFDLINYRENACKVHQLNPLWSEHNKSQYIKHALRETQTHRALNHPNIVKLFETFELDANTLCTILEFCNGPDLSSYLKQNKALQEKDAKLLIKQILFGLKYLHENQRKIIHYDLKPQNILFHAGEIKITDFGLCKVMESNTSLMELTSQGVGTYWYLPPECFEISETPPKITTKVDIWSVGVILFEMVFGEKPFGNNMSQEKILKEQVILSADAVKFPLKPAVSAECKELIANCLVKNSEKRWDVNQCLNSSFFAKK